MGKKRRPKRRHTILLREHLSDSCSWCCCRENRKRPTYRSPRMGRGLYCFRLIFKLLGKERTVRRKMYWRKHMRRIQNKYIICAGFGFCALNSAVVLIVQWPLPREKVGWLIAMTILFAAMAPIAMNDPRPTMQDDSYTWGIILSLLPVVSLVIFLALKVG